MESNKNDQQQENNNYKPEDIYEPEMINEDEGNFNNKCENETSEKGHVRKRKRKSRWGDKDNSIQLPTATLENSLPSNSSGNSNKINNI